MDRVKLEKKYSQLKTRHKECQEELIRCKEQQYEIDSHPDATIEHKDWARTRVRQAKAQATKALRAIYRLPPLT